MREFFKYASLNVLSMLALSCYILADTYFVSKGLGATGLTALNLAIPIYSFGFGTGLMIGMGASSKYSTFTYSKHKLKDDVFTLALLIGAVFSIVYMSIGVFFSGQLTHLLQADQSVFDMTNTYLKMILVFSPAYILNSIVLCFVRNDGNPKLSMIAMVSGSLSNVVLDYIFIFPFKMGIFGAVLATCMAPIISLCIMSSYFIKKKNKFHIQKTNEYHLIPSILSCGFPSLVTEVSSGIVIIVFNILILSIQGNIGVAAYGVIANLSLVVISMLNGVAQGIQPLFSRYYGLADYDEIQKTFRYGLCTILVLSALIYTFILFNADIITSIFNSENNIMFQDLAEMGLKLYFLACPFVGMNLLVSIYFTSINQAFKAHIVSILRGILLIVPLAFVFAYLFKMTGIWCVFGATEFIVCMIGTYFYIKSRRAV